MYVPVLLPARIPHRAHPARGCPRFGAMVQWGGVFNIVALLMFVVIAVASVIVGAPKRRPRPPTAHPAQPAPKESRQDEVGRDTARKDEAPRVNEA